jgi:hypothetical protein
MLVRKQGKNEVRKGGGVKIQLPSRPWTTECINYSGKSDAIERILASSILSVLSVLIEC